MQNNTLLLDKQLPAMTTVHVESSPLPQDNFPMMPPPFKNKRPRPEKEESNNDTIDLEKNDDDDNSMQWQQEEEEEAQAAKRQRIGNLQTSHGCFSLFCHKCNKDLYVPSGDHISTGNTLNDSASKLVAQINAEKSKGDSNELLNFYYCDLARILVDISKCIAHDCEGHSKPNIHIACYNKNCSFGNSHSVDSFKESICYLVLLINCTQGKIKRMNVGQNIKNESINVALAELQNKVKQIQEVLVKLPIPLSPQPQLPQVQPNTFAFPPFPQQQQQFQMAPRSAVPMVNAHPVASSSQKSLSPPLPPILPMPPTMLPLNQIPQPKSLNTFINDKFSVLKTETENKMKSIAMETQSILDSFADKIIDTPEKSEIEELKRYIDAKVHELEKLLEKELKTVAVNESNNFTLVESQPNTLNYPIQNESSLNDLRKLVNVQQEKITKQEEALKVETFTQKQLQMQMAQMQAQMLQFQQQMSKYGEIIQESNGELWNNSVTNNIMISCCELDSTIAIRKISTMEVIVTIQAINNDGNPQRTSKIFITKPLEYSSSSSDNVVLEFVSVGTTKSIIKWKCELETPMPSFLKFMNSNTKGVVNTPKFKVQSDQKFQEKNLLVYNSITCAYWQAKDGEEHVVMCEDTSNNVKGISLESKGLRFAFQNQDDPVYKVHVTQPVGKIDIGNKNSNNFLVCCSKTDVIYWDLETKKMIARNSGKDLMRINCIADLTFNVIAYIEKSSLTIHIKDLITNKQLNSIEINPNDIGNELAYNTSCLSYCKRSMCLFVAISSLTRSYLVGWDLSTTGTNFKTRVSKPLFVISLGNNCYVESMQIVSDNLNRPTFLLCGDRNTGLHCYDLHFKGNRFLTVEAHEGKVSDIKVM